LKSANIWDFKITPLTNQSQRMDERQITSSFFHNLVQFCEKQISLEPIYLSTQFFPKHIYSLWFARFGAGDKSLLKLLGAFAM